MLLSSPSRFPRLFFSAAPRGDGRGEERERTGRPARAHYVMPRCVAYRSGRVIQRRGRRFLLLDAKKTLHLAQGVPSGFCFCFFLIPSRGLGLIVSACNRGWKNTSRAPASFDSTEAFERRTSVSAMAASTARSGRL